MLTFTPRLATCGAQDGSAEAEEQVCHGLAGHSGSCPKGWCCKVPGGIKKPTTATIICSLLAVSTEVSRLLTRTNGWPIENPYRLAQHFYLWKYFLDKSLVCTTNVTRKFLNKSFFSGEMQGANSIKLSANSKPTEFAQPRLSRVKRRSSPARGYKVGCVCSYTAGHYPGILMTGLIGTNTPKFVPPCWGRPPFDPTQTGLCKFGWFGAR